MVGINRGLKHKSGTNGSVSDLGRRRSPNFPCIDLEKALEMTEKIYRVDKRSPITVDVLISRWGLPKYNSYVRQLIAALSYYGLVNSTGKGIGRRIAVSDSAYRILENAPDRDRLIKSAALTPRLFNEVWRHYRTKGLPEDEVLEKELVWQNSFADTRFTPSGAKSFVNNLKSTISFAGIVRERYRPGDENGLGVPDVIEEENNTTTKQSYRRLNLTLGSGEVATIQIPKSITKKEMEYLQDGIRLIEGALFPGFKSDNS